MEVNSYLLRNAISVSLSASGPIGTAAATVDVVSNARVRTSAAGLDVTLPVPSDTRDGRTFVVMNAGAENFTFYGATVAPDEYAEAYFDGGVWHSQASKASACPGPMTRTALLALRNSAGLSKDCHYVVTDYNRGTVGAAEILLHAVDASTLSMDVSVKTGFDTLAWDGRYDIDTNRIVELNDDRGNKVTGQEVVDTFPWGNAALTDNIVEEGASFTYTAGASVSDNVVRSGANVVLNNTGAGNFAGNEISQRANVTWEGGDFRENVVEADSTVTSSTTGDVDNNVFSKLAVVNVTGGNLDTSHIGEASNWTQSGGNASDNVVEGDSTIEVLGGQVYENHFGGSSVFRQTVATRNFYENNLTRNSSVIQGDIPIHNSEFSFAVVNTTGSTGGGIRYAKFLDSRNNSTMQNIAALDVGYLTVSNNSQISATGAQRVYLRYVTLENYGRLIVSAGAQLDANYTGVRDYSYIQVVAGRLFANYSTLSGVSYIQNNTPNTNRVDRVTVASASRIRFLNTANECRVYYSTVMSGSFIEHRGTSTGCYVYYCEATSASQIYSNNSVNWRCYYNSVSGNSEISSQGMTGTHYTYYCVCAAHGYLRMRDGLGRFYAIHASGQGLVTLTGGTALSRLYSSTVQAYYYLNLNATSLPGTRTAIAASGRRSYTPTTAIPSGTFTQNF